MRKPLTLTISLLFIAIISLTAQTHVDEIRANLFDPNLKEVLVVSHRGDWRNFPENVERGALLNVIKANIKTLE